MSKIKFQTTCPGCGDTHLAIECKKPSFITPTLVKAFCDNCESTVLVRVTLPRNRTGRSQISYQFQSIVPSLKLIQMLEAKQALEKLTEEKPPEVNV